MSGPFAFLRRLFVRDEPMTEQERRFVRNFLIGLKYYPRTTDADLSDRTRRYARLALRHGYADDGTAGLPFYRVTPNGERFLQEFER